MQGWLIMDLYTLVLAILLCVFSFNMRHERDRQKKLFLGIFCMVAVLTFCDCLGRISPARGLTKFAKYLVFMFNPAYYVLMFEYIGTWMLARRRLFKLVRKAINIMVMLNCLLVTVSSVGGLKWFFYYDERGNYYRGRFYLGRAALMLLVCLLVEAYIYYRRNDIAPHYRKIMMLYPLISIIAGIIQLFIKLPLEYVGMAVSGLIFTGYMQSRDVNMDYLTGAQNRRSFDINLEERIANFTRELDFAGIMIDVDFFKSINDQFGHDMGDVALIDVYSILYQSFRRGDVIARYGGDEFMVLADNMNRDTLEIVAQRVRDNLEEFNRTSGKPYKLSLSLGYDLYSHWDEKGAEEFVKYIDELMYEDKKKHHAERKSA